MLVSCFAVHLSFPRALLLVRVELSLARPLDLGDAESYVFGHDTIFRYIYLPSEGAPRVAMVLDTTCSTQHSHAVTFCPCVPVRVPSLSRRAITCRRG